MAPRKRKTQGDIKSKRTNKKFKKENVNTNEIIIDRSDCIVDDSSLLERDKRVNAFLELHKFIQPFKIMKVSSADEFLTKCLNPIYIYISKIPNCGLEIPLEFGTAFSDIFDKVLIKKISDTRSTFTKSLDFLVCNKFIENASHRDLILHILNEFFRNNIEFDELQWNGWQEDIPWAWDMFPLINPQTVFFRYYISRSNIQYIFALNDPNINELSVMNEKEAKLYNKQTGYKMSSFELAYCLKTNDLSLSNELCTSLLTLPNFDVSVVIENQTLPNWLQSRPKINNVLLKKASALYSYRAQAISDVLYASMSNTMPSVLQKLVVNYLYTMTR